MSTRGLDPLIHDELGRAGHVRTGTTDGDRAPTTVALTCDGRAALDRYTAALRQLPEEARQDHQAPPGTRAGGADREAAAAALGEHFAQGRPTLHELGQPEFVVQRRDGRAGLAQVPLARGPAGRGDGRAQGRPDRGRVVSGMTCPSGWVSVARNPDAPGA
jgi:hypothetical protein